MIKSIANINALLVDIKTANSTLSIQLQQAGFNIALPMGYEGEYTVDSVISIIDALTVQFLTITANRNQFIQRTSYTERQEIESCLRRLFVCIKQTRNTLQTLANKTYQVTDDYALGYICDNATTDRLALFRAIDCLDQLKPFVRMLELVIAQERIHALSSVLETLLYRENPTTSLSQEDDNELTEEQQNALELSHYLIKQAL